MSNASTVGKKVLIVGDGGVGKTALIKKLKTDTFIKQYITTMGAEVHPINVDGGTLQVWDTAGQEKFSGLRQGYYIESDMCLIMYDNTSIISYKNVHKLIRDVQQVCPNIPILVVKNKCDVDSAKNTDSYSDVSISVRSGKGIDKLLDLINKTLFPPSAI